MSKYVRNYVIKYRTDLDDLDEEQLSSKEDLHLLRDETKEFIKEKCSAISVAKQLRNPHQLISNHKEEMSYRKKRDRELSHEDSFLFDSHVFASKTIENVAYIVNNTLALIDWEQITTSLPDEKIKQIRDSHKNMRKVYQNI